MSPTLQTALDRSPLGELDRRPGLDPRRLVRLMRAGVRRLALDLAGRTVVTEAATGAYAVTPVIAALGGARQVHAVARDSRFGTTEDVIAHTHALASTAGVDHRIDVVTSKHAADLAAADIVTNSGHLRPLDADTVGRLKTGAAIPLTYEAWEFRPSDVDLDACRERGIRVAGTNERHAAARSGGSAGGRRRHHLGPRDARDARGRPPGAPAPARRPHRHDRRTATTPGHPRAPSTREAHGPCRPPHCLKEPGVSKMQRVTYRLVVATMAALVVPLAGPAAVRAADPCAPLVNAIACENSKPGTPQSTWDISGSGSSSIQGFGTDISVNRGDTISFKIKTNSRSYKLDIYRMGYYQGNGARYVTTVMPSVALPQSQPACINQTSTGLIDCGNWAVSASWTVPADAVSGIYFAKVIRQDGARGSSHIVFVVRDDASHSDLLFQTSDTTWQAYNSYGGNSLYTGQPAGRAYKVSYNRPFTTRGTTAEDFVFNAEYPAVRWLEANGYDVSYSTDLDSDRRGALIPQHRVFLSVGHDEYWSGGQRQNVEAARNAGVNLAFLSGNESFWKTRWEPSIDGSATAYRTLVCYKETHANQVIDPLDPPIWTGTWRDPRFSPPADGGRPENALSGTIFMVNGPRNDAIKVPGTFAPLRFWRNTSVAGLSPSATKTMPAGTLGYEWDEELDNGARPAGLIRLSSATYDVSPNLLLDYGSSYGNGTATHNATLYRAAGGALVFGAGTIQWSWGLDATHDNAGAPADRDMQQATLNLFADMGVQPGTRQATLTAASPSTDTTAPTATITSPGAGATASVGNPVTVSGTATDAGGGVVGGVEVSADDGQTWHPASGTGSWTYTWTPQSTGTATLRARATDDSANLGAPSAGVTVTVGGRSCPCSIWPDTAVPLNPNEADASAVELGVKFRADVAGSITGVRFYKSSQNTGTHVGRLWSASGQLLRSATFSGETASGWQRVTFASPVPVSANTTYVASYGAPNGHYADDTGAFTSAGVDSAPLHALRSGVDGPNGVWANLGAFPTNAYLDSNYWVDVIFTAS